MSDQENLEHARAQKEAVEVASKATSSANRARLWAGLNRYLAAEAEQARKAARKEREAKAEQAETEDQEQQS
jgi:hypothetical protein